MLDSGCGSGEHTLLAASLGLPALGVDVAESALAMALAKWKERGGPAEFVLADALHLEGLSRTFDTAIHIRTAFSPATGWHLADLEESEIEVTLDAGRFPAWLATIHRV